MFPRDLVCLRNISVDTLHRGDTDDDDDDDDDDNDNNNNNNVPLTTSPPPFLLFSVPASSLSKPSLQ